MTTLSRRKVLMALVAAPVATLAPRISCGASHGMTVADVMRYLNEEVFPSRCQKRNESYCSIVRSHKKSVA